MIAEHMRTSERADYLTALLDNLTDAEQRDLGGTVVITGRDAHGRPIIYVADHHDEAMMIRT